MTAADKVRRARLDAALTQEQLAERMGLSKQSICNVEAGRQLPSLEWLHRAAVALGCKPSALDERLTDRAG